MKQSLLTASWGSHASSSPFEGLPFRVTPTARLKLAKRVSNMLMFTESGTISVQVEGVIEGWWDRLRLEQILTNLLSNAVKYGAGRPITVEVGASGPGGDVWIAVRDRGIGMTPDELGRIFGRFERGVSERNYGGLGLGLWIVRQVVDAMGGSVTVDSAPEHGSTFTVRLPHAVESRPSLQA